MTKRNLLSLPVLLSLVVGNMIGTGIYVLPASLAQYGNIAILSWVFTGVGALFIALTFAKLNHRIPHTGGPFIFCKVAFGRLWGFIIGYTYWLSNIVAISAIAVSSLTYMGYLTPYLDANSPLYHRGYALGLELCMVWLFTIINIIGIQTAGFVQLAITTLKIIPLILIILLGFAFVHIDNLLPLTTGGYTPVAAISNAAALTFWGFIGLESATMPADNAATSKHVYLATVIGTMLTALIYLLSTTILMGLIPQMTLQASQFPYSIAGTMLFGPKAAAIIAWCAVISGLGTLNVCILIQGQIAIAMGKENLLPKVLARKSTHDVPIYGQIFSSALISLFLIATTAPTLLKQFDKIALLAGLLTLIAYFVSTLAEIKFSFAKEERKKWFRVPSNYIAVFATLYGAWMLSCFDLGTLTTAAILLCSTIPVYYLIKIKL